MVYFIKYNMILNWYNIIHSYNSILYKITWQAGRDWCTGPEKKIHPTEKRSAARFVVFLCGFQKGLCFWFKTRGRFRYKSRFNFLLPGLTSWLFESFFIVLKREGPTHHDPGLEIVMTITILFIFHISFKNKAQHILKLGWSSQYSSAAHWQGFFWVTQPFPIWRVVTRSPCLCAVIIQAPQTFPRMKSHSKGGKMIPNVTISKCLWFKHHLQGGPLLLVTIEWFQPYKWPKING